MRYLFIHLFIYVQRRSDFHKCMYAINIHENNETAGYCAEIFSNASKSKHKWWDPWQTKYLSLSDHPAGDIFNPYKLLNIYGVYILFHSPGHLFGDWLLR